jgi:hypothetical protein
MEGRCSGMALENDMDKTAEKDVEELAKNNILVRL